MSGYDNSKTVVFVIDDELEIVNILSAILSEKGFTVHGFTRAKDAIDSLQKYDPDVVFTDVHMPEIDGLALLKKIKYFSFDLPVIFITAYADKHILLNAISDGICNVVEKPFNAEIVISMATQARYNYRLLKLISKSIHVISLHFSVLEKYISYIQNEDEKNLIISEINSLRSQFKQDNKHKKTAA